jgi:hypothetical protein
MPVSKTYHLSHKPEGGLLCRVLTKATLEEAPSITGAYGLKPGDHPTALAQAILADHLAPAPVHSRLAEYAAEDFCRQFLTGLDPTGGILDAAEVEAWLIAWRAQNRLRGVKQRCPEGGS